MYTRVLLAICFATMFATSAFAQGTGVFPSALLRAPGESYGVLLVPPSGLTAQPTFSFPSTSGTLLISSSTATPTFGGLTVNGSTTLGSGLADVVTINGATVTAPNLTTTSTFANVLVLNGGNIEVSTATFAVTAGALANNAPVRTNGSGALTTGNLNLASEVTGTLPVTNGGTGLSSVATGNILYASAANTLAALAIGSPGEYLGITAGLPQWKSLANDMWVLGGNGVGITGTSNILGINYAAGVPLRLYVEGKELMRLNANGVARVQNLDAAGATTLSVVGTSSQGVTNLVNVSNSDANSLVRIDEQPAGIARIQIGDAALDSRLRMYNGATGGVASIDVQSNLATTRTYTLPTIEGNGRFVVADAAGTSNQILQSNGDNNRTTWTSSPSLVGLTLSGDLQVDGNATLGDAGTDVVTINATTVSAVNLPTTGTTANVVVRNAGNLEVSTATFAVTAGALANNSPVRTNGSGALTTGATDLASSDVTGTLPYGNGGTGATSYTTNGVVYAGASALASTAAGTTGQVLVGNTGGAPTWSSTIPSGVTVSFADVSAGTNANALLVSGSLAPSGGTITANALSSLAANGIVARTAAGTFTNRTITGTAPISVTNGDGVSGDPTIALTGTVAVANGGTGSTSFTGDRVIVSNNAGTALVALATANNGMLVTNGTGVPSISTTFPSGVNVPFSQVAAGTNANALLVSGSLAPSGGTITANRFVSATSASNAVDLDATSAEVSGVLPLANGGTGATSFAGNRVIASNAGGTALTAIATGSNGDLLSLVGGVPTWITPAGSSFSTITTGTNSTATMTVNNGASILLGTAGAIIEANKFKAGGATDAVDLATAEVAGVLPVANGGTGLATVPTNAIVYGNGVGVMQTATPGNNQILTSNGTGVPTWSSSAPTGFSVNFSQVAAGTNANALLVSGSLAPSGGTITANRFATATSATDLVDLDATSAEVSGTLPLANGGTGATAFAGNRVIASNAGGTALTAVAAGTNGDVLSLVGGVPTWITPPGSSFSAITTGNNSTATMTVDNGASILLGTAGAVIEANRFRGTGSSTNAVDLATAEVAGVLPIANGGTGASTAGAALTALGAQAQSANLDALSALATTGIMVRTGVATYATRSLASGNAMITVTNADGTSANPTVTLNTVTVPFGGTGLTTAPINSILYASAANTYSSLTPGNNQILTSNGTGVPTWSSSVPSGFNVPFTNVTTGASTGTLTVTGAGTLSPTAGGTITANALSSLAADGMVARTASGTFAARTITGTANEITVTNGSGVAGDPTISIPAAVTFTGKTITGGTYAGITTNNTTTVTGLVVATAGSTTPTPATGAGTNLAAFTRMFEKVTVGAGGASATFINLPTGADGQIAYVEFTCNNTTGATAVTLRQPDASTATAVSWAAGANTRYMVHMIYTSSVSRWAILSVVANP